MYDSIIIGAGLSGLAAGIRAAYYDQRVCILERHTTIGGLNSFYRLDGRNYDVGLHAMTNFVKRGTKRGPLARILRQLRFRWDDFQLCPQTGSRIAFPGVQLAFNNEFEFLESEVAREFPAQKDRFRQLANNILDYDDINPGNSEGSAREFVANYITDPLLIEMLFCPLMYYGSAREDDMDYGQFCIMFRSIFFEGFARPKVGVRLILKLLVRRFKELGGELKLRAGVKQLVCNGDSVNTVVLDDGTELAAKRVLSSAGWVETMGMCDASENRDDRTAGELTFVEILSTLDKQPTELGFDETIVFFNDCEKFEYRKPNQLIDTRSGVICSPNNFHYDEPLDEGMIRVTALANYDLWNALPEEEYYRQKELLYDTIVESSCRFIPEYKESIVSTDMFTPTTIRHFTGHANGTVYGCPQKQFDGKTHLENLFVCGTDQGFVGIIGAMMSGVSIANQYLLLAD